MARECKISIREGHDPLNSPGEDVWLCTVYNPNGGRVAGAESAKPRPWHRGLCHSHPPDEIVFVGCSESGRRL